MTRPKTEPTVRHRPHRNPVWHQDDAGVTSTEVAVLMPAIIVVIMMVFQVGMFWHAKQSADVAAEEAVESAQVATATDVDGYDGAATILSQAGNLRNAEITINRDDAAGTVTVIITGDAPSIIPFGSWGITAQAQGTIERFIPADQR